MATNDYLAAIEILEKRALKAEEELEAVKRENEKLIEWVEFCASQRDLAGNWAVEGAKKLLKGGE